MKVKELMQVVTSATVIKAWANRTASETDGEYIGSFGVLKEFEEQYGECEVIGVYPESKDYLYVSIKVKPKRTRKCKKVYWHMGRDGKLYSQNYMDGMFGIEQDEISGWQIRTFGMKTKASAIKYSFGRELIEYSL